MTIPNQKSECEFCKDFPDGDFGICGKCSRKLGKEEKSFSDFFHKASAEEKEKVILEVVKEANEEQRMNYERNYSHTHCWKQVDFDMEEHDLDSKATPACGIPLEKHIQCCLCDTPVPEEKDHDKNNCENCQDVMTGFTPTVESEEKEALDNAMNMIKENQELINYPMKAYTPQESEDWAERLKPVVKNLLPYDGEMAENVQDILDVYWYKLEPKIKAELSKSYQRGREEGKLELVDDQLAGKIPYYDMKIREAKSDILSLAVQEIEKAEKEMYYRDAIAAFSKAKEIINFLIKEK